MMPASFPHTAISASAGTGKTYALAHRYIALVQGGVAPDRICALTFSRKAAGEIFDEIVRHLCAGAGDARKAAESSRRIGTPLQPAEFIVVLRRVTDHLHRLHISTIDSFVVGVVRAFPFELGLSPEFRIGESEGAGGDEVRRTLLGRLFDPDVTSEPARLAFLEAFKLATFGQEQKALGKTLEQFIADLAGVHRRIPSPNAWGMPQTIWGSSLPWQARPADARDGLADTLGRTAWADSSAAGQLAELVAFLRAYDARREWSAELGSSTLFKRLWRAVSAPTGEPFVVKFGKGALTIPAAGADALRRLVAHAMSVELDRALRQTQGVERLLAQYEAMYAEQMHRSGQLGFDDLARLVADGTGFAPTRTAGTAERLFIDYRLDATLDHWLLDEFQDTSDLQWRVLGNLIDEVVQDDSRTRSFFYVGDVKQAIYGWRGGNHRLFNDVRERYGENIILEETLDRSHRSAPAIIETVNRIFGRLSPEDRLPAQALADWQKNWRDHETATPDKPGSVELLEADARDDESGADARCRAIAARLREIEPVRRGLQAAVLLRTNEQARRCADILRAALPDTPVALEGRASLLDNPLVPLLLSLVRFAAHPGDRLAWRHLQMSPLGIRSQKSEVRSQNLEPQPLLLGADAREEDAIRSALAHSLLDAIHRDGFQPVLREWCARLETAQPFDVFTRLRRDDLLDAAAAFDATGDRDCDRFTRFIDGYAHHSAAAGTAVRVMTIHQSKGLGFDLVCIPFDDNARSFDNPERADLLEAPGQRWVLKAPRTLVVETDAVLRDADARQVADAAFARLCVLYVALTRAKQGLILVVSPPPQKSAAVREDTLLRSRLMIDIPGAPRLCASMRDTEREFHRLHISGDPMWFHAHARQMEESVAPAGRPATLRPGAPCLMRMEPSKHDPGVRPAAAFFPREAGDVRVFGSAIHRLFQQIEWLEEFDLERVVPAWRAAAPEPAAVLRDVERQFRDSLTKPEVLQALRRPAGTVDLWREKPFELLHEGKLLAGQFDRVAIHRNPAGQVFRAELFDFKSNRVESDDALRAAARRHQEQMALYTAALRRILGPVPVVARLVFTRAGRVVEV